MTPTDDDRLLFIGFGKLPGYSCFDWTDDKWLNASDYRTVLVNNISFDAYIKQFTKVYAENEDVRTEIFSAVLQLNKKLENLKAELVKVLFTGRRVYALATKQLNERFGQDYLSTAFLQNYAWSPFKFQTSDGEGEARITTNESYTEYASLIKQWEFTFLVMRNIDHLMTYSGIPKLPDYAKYEAFKDDLVTTLSHEPFCVTITCGQLQEGKREPIWISGGLTLLHYPPNGNLLEALNRVLRTFTTATVSNDTAPSWVSTVRLPAAEDIDRGIQTIETEMDALTARLSDLRTERKRFEKWLPLLYATGEELELVVAEALALLGLDDVKRGPKSYWDLSFNYQGRSYIVEVKGLTKGLGRREVFDLDRHMDEYELKTGTAADKGVLIFCPFRNVPPTERDPQTWVAGDAITHAEPLGFSLMSTLTLFDLVSAHLTGGVGGVSQEVERLLNTVGHFTR